MSDAPPVLETRAVHKRFGPVVALRGADFRVHRGEVVGLVGDNGAGKSTLMKILSGVHPPDSGSLRMDGEEVRFSAPRAARDRGIEMVYQDLSLCETLDVAANLFLGREPTRFGLLRIGEMHELARRQLEDLGIQLPTTHISISSLSGGQRQAVAIGRSVSFSPRVLILDEPTASLGVREVSQVLRLIDRVRDRGVAVVLISHRLQDILEVCDRVVVMFDGGSSAELDIDGITIEDIVDHIVGSRLGTANGTSDG